MNADDLRILILEDSQKDAELIEHELRKGGIAFQSKRVKTRDDFISQLEFFSPQIILADYKLPAFTGIEAFNLIKEKGLDTPFIVVSGTLGEELAIATLKTGVTDYILKDNLQRLAPAVNRALAEIKTALERREALKALQENEKRFKTIATYTYDWENWIGPEGEVFWVNPAVERMTGFSVQEIMAMKDFPASLLADEDRERGLKEFRNAVKNRNPGGGIVIRFRRKDGEIFWGGIAWQQIFDEKGESIGHRSSIRDITKRKQAEEAQRIAYERLRGFIDSNIVGVVIAEAQGKVVEANDYYLNIIEATQEDLKQEKVDWRAITPPEWIPADDKAILELRERGIPISYEKEYIRPDGSRVSVMLSDTMLPGPGELIAAFVLDTTERKQTERALHKSEALYRSLFENMVNGFAYCKMVFDQGRPKDVIFLNVNKTFESLTGLKEVAGKKISELLPGIEEMDPELL
jgi:PAS domain S-box-containing protein